MRVADADIPGHSLVRFNLAAMSAPGLTAIRSSGVVHVRVGAGRGGPSMGKRLCDVSLRRLARAPVQDLWWVVP